MDSPHNRKPRAADEEDPFEAMIKRTGCYEKHTEVQECMFNHQDWRRCQQEVKQFKECMNEYQRRKQAN